MPPSVAIVTGASYGVGPHIATALARAGHPVVLAARTTGLLEKHAAEISHTGGSAVAVTADLTLSADRQTVVDKAREIGPLGILVNNAAVGPIAHFHQHQPTEISNAIDLNVTAPFDLARLTIAEMIRTGRTGRIINIATVAARLPMPQMVLYSATKAALTELSRVLNLEYGSRGIRATTILPGAVAEVGMAVRVVEETGVDIPNDGAVPPSAVAEAVMSALHTPQPEIFVGTGSKFMTRHPRIAYRLMRRAGIFTALSQAADAHDHTPHQPTAA